jgi:predicted NBD/HSP70 family sugar kinase
MNDAAAPLNVFAHAARTLTAVTVDTFNEELQEIDGFVGDRASGRAFRKILDELRAKLMNSGHEDPFGEIASREISKSKLDKILVGKDPMAAGLVHTAVEEFGKELAGVIRAFMALPAWAGTERIAIGGGLSASHIGELAMGRAAIILAEDCPVELRSTEYHPDEAGLIGAVQLAPSWMLEGHDGLLAVDIGGTNIRAGLIKVKLKDTRVTKAEMVKRLHWKHRSEKPTRDHALDRIAGMLKELRDAAEPAKLTLAPFIGVGCPGLIDERGIIVRGGQNLPGNWEGEDFNLVHELVERVKKINGHEPSVVLHNDAVVQGLSEVPNMDDVERWGVLTIGTGLGNARFTNRGKKKKKKDKE